MDNDTLNYILSRQTPRTYEPGEILFSQGEPACEFYYLLSGLSLTYTILQDGRERNMLMTWPNRIFGASTFFEGVNRRASAIAIRRCKLLVINAEEYQNCCKKFPAFREYIMAEMAKDLGIMFDELTDTSMTNAPQRVARFCCRRLANGQHEGTQETPELFYTQELIANVLGISRMSVSKAIATLNEFGWIESSYGTIRIIDTASLRKYAYG